MAVSPTAPPAKNPGTIMKITEIKISVFEMTGVITPFDLVESGRAGHRRWRHQPRPPKQSHMHVLHVRTDEGLEGVCPVGDGRYMTMPVPTLEQLRILALGEDPLDRERLFQKMKHATRQAFAPYGWFGAFDNCLWDIAGKAAGMPVCSLMGRVRERAPAYYNIRGDSMEKAVEDSEMAVGMGFPALKDHFVQEPGDNIEWFRAVRDAVGPDVDLMHDPVGMYTFGEAVRIGRALEECDFRWLEEPMNDVRQNELQNLCDTLDIPVLNPESLTNAIDLSAQWLISGAADLLRVSARHGSTSVLKLAHLAELHGTNVEMHGAGGLFGLVHTHLNCAIANTSYYEFFPGGIRDEIGKEIGMTNPPLPSDGHMTPPQSPGWGAEWDWDYFRKKTVAEL